MHACLSLEKDGGTFICCYWLSFVPPAAPFLSFKYNDVESA